MSRLSSQLDLGFRIEGDVRLERALESVSGKIRKGIMRKAVREAARPIIQQARANLLSGGHIRKRNLYRSIGQAVRTYPSGYVLSVVGPRYPQGAHGHLVEFGTGPRWSGGDAFLLVGKKGEKLRKFALKPAKRHYHGQMPASPFLLPAFYARWRAGLTIMRLRAWREIDLAARQYAKRAVA